MSDTNVERTAKLDTATILRGDADGVVVILKAREEDVLEIAEAIDAAEGKIRAHLEAGKRLDEARQLMKYHELQTPEDS